MYHAKSATGFQDDLILHEGFRWHHHLFKRVYISYLASLPTRNTPPRVSHHFFALVCHPETSVGVLVFGKDRFVEIT